MNALIVTATLALLSTALANYGMPYYSQVSPLAAPPPTSYSAPAGLPYNYWDPSLALPYNYVDPSAAAAPAPALQYNYADPATGTSLPYNILNSPYPYSAALSSPWSPWSAALSSPALSSYSSGWSYYKK